MSFLRPTASSLRRAVASAPAEPTRGGAASTTTTAAAAAPPPPAPPAHSSARAEYGHVAGRVDTGLRSRVRTSALPHRAAPPPTAADTRSPVLREFADRCTTVIQRAEAVLERSLEQEARVTTEMEGRHSQSPGRQSTPPPSSQPEASTPPQRTPPAPAAAPTPYASPAQTPAVPRAPPTTPASPSQTPAPPPTPNAARAPAHGGSPPPSQPGTGGAVDAAARSPSPSLLQRLRQSMQRGRGTAGEASVTASPVPCSPDGAALAASASRVSPRKSVRFVSADKLETVTPTKVVAFSSDEDEGGDYDDYGIDADEEDEEVADDASDDEEKALLPLSKRARTDSSTRRHTRSTSSGGDGGRGAHGGRSLQRPSAPLPPAPPPSAVKEEEGRRSSSSSGASGSHALPSASTPLSPGQRTRSPSASSESARATPPYRGSSGGRSSTSSTRPVLDHEELKAYVRQHTIRRSLHRITRANMEEFLLDEGEELPLEGHLLKRRLLKRIRDLLRQEEAM